MIAQPMPVFNSLEKAAQTEQCEMLLSWQRCLGLVRDQPAQIAWDSHQENPSREHHCRGQHKLSEEAKEGEEEREMKRRKPSSKCSSVIRKIH